MSIDIPSSSTAEVAEKWDLESRHCCISSMAINTWNFPLSVLWHWWLGDRKGIGPVKNWVLVCWRWYFDWSFARLITPVVTTTSITLAPIKSRMETCWYRLTQIHLEMAVKMDRDKYRKHRVIALWWLARTAVACRLLVLVSGICLCEVVFSIRIATSPWQILSWNTVIKSYALPDVVCQHYQYQLKFLSYYVGDSLMRLSTVTSLEKGEGSALDIVRLSVCVWNMTVKLCNII